MFFCFCFVTLPLSLYVGTIIKRQLHNNFSGLFYGLPFTKPNPDFVQSVKTQFPPESKLLVVCQEGLRFVYDFLPNLTANYLHHLVILTGRSLHSYVLVLNFTSTFMFFFSLYMIGFQNFIEEEQGHFLYILQRSA